MELWIGITAGIIALNLIFWWYLLQPCLKWLNFQLTDEPPLPLSVVIAARNEKDNLTELLPLLRTLEYKGEWEVVVVLDRCTDGSLELVAKEMEEWSQLSYVKIRETEAGWAPKKWALTQGIAAAQHDLILLTDADCRPEAEWLTGMGDMLSMGEEVVIGLGPYLPQEGFLSQFQQYETCLTAILYTARARRGQPYMAVGRNLGFRRGIFEQVGGYEKHKGRLSGDDDLFIRDLPENTRLDVVHVPGARTWSEPEPTWSRYIRQKKRHLSAGTAYSGKTKRFLATFHLGQLLTYGAVIALAVAGAWLEAGGLLLLRQFILHNWIIRLARQWAGMVPYRWFFVLDFSYQFYNLCIVPFSLFSQPKWKG